MKARVGSRGGTWCWLSGICQALGKGKRGWCPSPLADSALLAAPLTPPLPLAFLCSPSPPHGLWRPMAFSHQGRVSPSRLLAGAAAGWVALSVSRQASPEPSGTLPAAPVLSSWTFPSSLWCRQTSGLPPQGTGAFCVSGHHAVTWRIGNFWAPRSLAGGKMSTPASPPGHPLLPWAAWPSCALSACPIPPV